jgi:2-polyprenyl-3-methyl-5-hydroxy-6-metoxy-1,4-benzoquinol methylase
MNYKNHELNMGLRDKLKPQWQEMLLPAKPRRFILDPYAHQEFLAKAEKDLSECGIYLVGKDILEVGCSHGDRSFLMAKYEGTKVHGIDVDEYIVNQSPDLNDWNPEDIQHVHNSIEDIRKELVKKFPKSVCDKVTFETCGMEHYVTPNPHDLIISWDVLEHILDLPLAFNQMANAIKKGGIVFHEYNPFFSVSGGHSLCTLDFYFGHCRISAEEFKEYIRMFRPEEEKIALNFYHKCLNRATISDIKRLSKQYGFEILKLDGHNPFGNPVEARQEIQRDVLPDVLKNYPNVTTEDLVWDSVHIILRKL